MPKQFRYFGVFLFFSKVENCQNNIKSLFCIMYKFHNSYFVFVALFAIFVIFVNFLILYTLTDQWSNIFKVKLDAQSHLREQMRMHWKITGRRYWPRARRTGTIIWNSHACSIHVLSTTRGPPIIHNIHNIHKIQNISNI